VLCWLDGYGADTTSPAVDQYLVAFGSAGSFLQAWGSGIQGKETKPNPDKTYIHIIAQVKSEK